MWLAGDFVCFMPPLPQLLKNLELCEAECESLWVWLPLKAPCLSDVTVYETLGFWEHGQLAEAPVLFNL